MYIIANLREHPRKLNVLSSTRWKLYSFCYKYNRYKSTRTTHHATIAFDSVDVNQSSAWSKKSDSIDASLLREITRSLPFLLKHTTHPPPFRFSKLNVPTTATFPEGSRKSTCSTNIPLRLFTSTPISLSIFSIFFKHMRGSKLHSNRPSNLLLSCRCRNLENSRSRCPFCHPWPSRRSPHPEALRELRLEHLSIEFLLPPASFVFLPLDGFSCGVISVEWILL